MYEINLIKSQLASDGVSTKILEKAILLPENNSTVIEEPKIKPVYPALNSLLFVNPFEKAKKKKKKGKKKKK